MDRKIVDAHADSRGNIEAVKLEGNKTFTSVKKAIEMTKRGEISGAHVVTPKTGKEYLRSNPDNQSRNNLDDLAGDR